MTPRATVTFHTSPEVKARLDRLADLTQRSRSWITNAAVERYLAEEEAFVAAVEEGLSQAAAGTFVPHERAAAWLRSVADGNPGEMPEPSGGEPDPRDG
jgi:predicted transcriptional regulator